jgi:large subunit ribosomal protein L25
VAGERIRLEVRERTRLGSAEARRLRRDGIIPGVLYGRGQDPHAIAVPERELRRALSGPGGLRAILDVVVGGEGEAHPSILKEYQRDPVRGTVSHVDFHQVRLDQPIQAQVSVTLVGDPVGVKEGGVLTQVTREVTVEALPLELPEHVDLDVGALGIGESLRIADLTAIEGVTFLGDPDEVLASVALPTRVVEPEEELEEGEEAAEGEAPEAAGEAEAPAAEAAEPAEPTEG